MPALPERYHKNTCGGVQSFSLAFSACVREGRDTMEWQKDLSIMAVKLSKLRSELINIRSGLVEAIKEHVCKYTIRQIIMSLERHIADSFAAEERFLQLSCYPEYLQQKAGHDRFRDDILNLKRDVIALAPDKQCGSYELSVETNCLIVDFVASHMDKADKNFLLLLEGERSKTLHKACV